MDIHGTSSAAAMGALPCFKAAWHRHNASGYAFILPALLVILCLVGYPFVMAIYLSLTDAWVGTEGKFVGFRNYSDLVLIGPSGCGKSTTLNLIAGIEEASEGRIFIGERPVNQLHPKDRDIAMVFQNYALYPPMNVYANMAFGLSMRGYSKTVIDRRIREAAEILGIGDLLLRKPKALSGGQRQRVAVGRAIVRKPAVFLFDEPLSNLDAKLRVQMRAELSKLHQRLNTTIVYVTHDQIEAMTMATRIVLLKDGVCQQIGRPLELYTRPVNTFTAGFIGTPPMNLVPARVEAPGGQVTLAGECFRLPIPVRLRPAYEGLKSREVIFGIRPEHLRGMRENDLPAGAKLKKIGKPVGIQLGHSRDGNGAMLALMWGYGAGITAKDGKTITINSPETIKAVEFVKTLYTDAMDPEVISWDDAANNRAVLAGTCSMAFNSPSIYKAAKSKDIRVPETDKPLADAIDHILPPAGPKGRFAFADCLTLGIWEFSKNKALAKEFLKSHFAKKQFDEFMEVAVGYNVHFPQGYRTHAVFTSDPKIRFIGEIGKYEHTIGYPGAVTAQSQVVWDMFIISDMFSYAATGKKSPKEAVEWADKEIKAIYAGKAGQ